MEKEWLWGVFEYLLCVIEVYILCGYFSGRYEKRWENRKFAATGITVLGSLVIYFKGMICPNFICGLVLAYITYTIIVKLAYQITLKQSALYIAFLYVIMVLIDVVVANVLMFFWGKETSEIIMQNGAFRTQAAIVSKLIFFSATKMLNINKGTELKSMSKPFGWILIVLYGISVINAICMAEVSIQYADDRSLNLILTLIAFGIIISNFIVYYLLKKLQESLENENEYRLLHYQNEMLVQSTLAKDEAYKEVRKMNHDFNNHISCIDMLLQMGSLEKARNYIKNMYEGYTSAFIDVHLGNAIADAVINQKFMLAKSKGIDFSIKGELTQEVAIDEMELCAILSNSLDNAIEASSKIKEEAERKVEITLKQEQDQLFIKVVNTVHETVDSSKPLQTSKKDKARHGIGMLNMEKIAKKHNGYLKWESHDRIFELNIMLKNE